MSKITGVSAGSNKVSVGNITGNINLDSIKCVSSAAVTTDFTLDKYDDNLVEDVIDFYTGAWKVAASAGLEVVTGLGQGVFDFLEGVRSGACVLAGNVAGFFGQKEAAEACYNTAYNYSLSDTYEGWMNDIGVNTESAVYKGSATVGKYTTGAALLVASGGTAGVASGALTAAYIGSSALAATGDNYKQNVNTKLGDKDYSSLSYAEKEKAGATAAKAGAVAGVEALLLHGTAKAAGKVTANAAKKAAKKGIANNKFGYKTAIGVSAGVDAAIGGGANLATQAISKEGGYRDNIDVLEVARDAAWTGAAGGIAGGMAFRKNIQASKSGSESSNPGVNLGSVSKTFAVKRSSSPRANKDVRNSSGYKNRNSSNKHIEEVNEKTKKNAEERFDDLLAFLEKGKRRQYGDYVRDVLKTGRDATAPNDGPYFNN